jgi:DNA-binding transcriptional ArsR family regulator
MTGLDCIAALKALGEGTRLRILRLLFKEPMSVNEIADRLKASQYNVSKHLRIMREADLLEVEKQGGETIAVESPRGSVTGTALLWDGIREDTIFVPNTFGPMQKMAEELHAPLYEPANTLQHARQ